MYEPVPPWRRDFDAARDPYTARNALGITATGGGGPFQPQDADLTSIAGYGGTGTWLYRSAADTWSPVMFGTGISFSGGTLSATVSAYTDEQAQDATAAALAAGTHTAITVTYNDTANSLSLANTDRGSTAVATHEAASDPHPQYLTATEGNAAYQPVDADLTSIAGYGGTGAWLYRSAANTWSAVTLGSGLTFTSGTLDAPVFTSSAKGEVPASGGGTANFLRADGTWTAPAGGGDVTQAGTNTFTGSDYFNLGANLPLVVGHNAKIATGYSLDVNGASIINGIADTRWSADATGAQLTLRKSRGAAVGSNTVVSSGDTLGKVSFAGNHGTGFQTGGPAVSGVCNSAPFGTNTPGYVLIEAAAAAGTLVSAATFKDTGCALLGVNDGSDAAAGWVGEYKIADVAAGSAIALGSGVANSIASFSLTAGDWDVALQGFFTGAATTNATAAQVSISTTSNAIDGVRDRVGILPCPAAGFVGFAQGAGVSIPMRRVNVAPGSSPQTVYFTAFAKFTGGALSVFGAMTARRIR